LLPHVVVHFHIEHIRDQVQSILVVLDFCVQASQVETIREVVLVDFAEVLVATRGNELRSTSESDLKDVSPAYDMTCSLPLRTSSTTGL
jgi:hypothetical protein